MLRKKKLINSTLQLKLITVFLFTAFISALFQVFLINRSIMSLSSQMQNDGDILLKAIPGILLSNLTITLAVLVPLMLIVGVLITHRVAGPVYRFERHLDSIIAGEKPGACHIRKDDELQELCAKINQAVAKLESDNPNRQGESQTEGRGTKAA